MLADLGRVSDGAASAPWNDDRSARQALSPMACAAAGTQDAHDPKGVTRPTDRTKLVAWLIANDLAAVGHAWAARHDAESAAMLRANALGTAASNLAHFAMLERIERRFESERIPMVLLKGAAVASASYHDASLRSMSDLDIWVRDEDMPRAVGSLAALGLRQEPGLPGRPEALQRRSCGELIFRKPESGHGLVELHFGAFQGWWIQRAAGPDGDAVWRRATPVAPGRHACRLAHEDAILQTAFHVVVNQFGQAPWRGMMDLAVLARAHAIDWDAVARCAKDWRIATAIWLVLDTAERLFGLPGSGAALASLRPGRARRAALRAFTSPAALLASRDLTRRSRRHLFMLSLVDRPRDGARLIGRTLWPEDWWIAARYGRPVSRAAHLWELVRRGAV